eukprot:6027834-Alexandrium_andersonii.AAC.1
MSPFRGGSEWGPSEPLRREATVARGATRPKWRGRRTGLNRVAPTEPTRRHEGPVVYPPSSGL